MIFPLLRLLRGKSWPRIFSRYLCFFWSHHSQCIFHIRKNPVSFHIVNVQKDDLSLIFPLLRGKRWPRIFSRYLCFFWSHHSQCIFHIRKNPVSFHIVNVEKDDLSLIFPFVTGKKMAQNFFLVPLFLLESSLSVYFPFVTFVTLISTWTRKNPVTFVSYCKC